VLQIGGYQILGFCANSPKIPWRTPKSQKKIRMFLAKPPRADENGILGRFWAIIKQHFPFTGIPHKIA